MTYLLMIRERIKSFYSRYEGFCNPALKFILAFIAFRMINKNINFAAVLTSLPITLILSLLCSFFPMNFILVMSVLVILLHLYALSLETVLITGVFFLVLFLMYFRFSPKDTILLIMTPLCFVLKIPYVIPICAGLVAAPTSVISTGCGVVTYHLLHYIAGNSSALMTQEACGSLLDHSHDNRHAHRYSRYTGRRSAFRDQDLHRGTYNRQHHGAGSGDNTQILYL